MSLDSLFPADESEPFGRRGLDRNTLRIDSHRLGQCFSHGGDVRLYLRALQAKRAIDVAYAVAFVAEHFNGMPQQDPAVDTLEPLGSVRKMKPDVAHSRRSEQRVAQRVDQRVAVGMRDAAARMFDQDASQSEGEAVGERVHIVAVPDSEVVHSMEFVDKVTNLSLYLHVKTK